MRNSLGIALAAVMILPLGCTTTAPAHNEEDVRRTAAAATNEIKSDIKGTAEGIRDGLRAKTDSSSKLPADSYLNINNARIDQLAELPGVTTHMASEMVHGRPYRSVSELRDRRILPKSIYERNASRLTVGN